MTRIDKLREDIKAKANGGNFQHICGKLLG